jgi:hypothetical protein
MKHADVRALEAVSDLIENLRRRSVLVEKPLGTFYIKGRAFLHFHKDPTGLFADLRQGRDWVRFPVNDPNECASLLAAVDQAHAGASHSQI